jgi:C_GCAxxG_C_C family probable redox protein
MTKLDHALDLFSKKHNCAQAILAAYGPAEGLDEKRCAMIAAPFGGGIARLGETCGAVSGALMVLGLRYGAATTIDPAAKAEMYKRAQDFIERFRARNRSVTCRDLLGLDLGTEEGWQEAQQRKTHVIVCPKFIRDAAEILDEMQSASA